MGESPRGRALGWIAGFAVLSAAGWWAATWTPVPLSPSDARRPWVAEFPDPVAPGSGLRVVGLTRSHATDVRDGRYLLAVTELDPASGEEGPGLSRRRPDLAARVPGWGAKSMPASIGSVSRVEILWEAVDEGGMERAMAGIQDRRTGVWLDHGSVEPLGGSLHYAALFPPALHDFPVRVVVGTGRDRASLERLPPDLLRSGAPWESGARWAGGKREWVFDWASLEGYPPENRDLANLFDARVPCLVLQDVADGPRLVAGLSQLIWRAAPHPWGGHPVGWKDMRLGDILREIDQADPDGALSANATSFRLEHRTTARKQARDWLQVTGLLP